MNGGTKTKMNRLQRISRVLSDLCYHFDSLWLVFLHQITRRVTLNISTMILMHREIHLCIMFVAQLVSLLVRMPKLLIGGWKWTDFFTGCPQRRGSPFGTAVKSLAVRVHQLCFSKNVFCGAARCRIVHGRIIPNKFGGAGKADLKPSTVATDENWLQISVLVDYTTS